MTFLRRELLGAAASAHDVWAKFRPFVGAWSNAVDSGRRLKAYHKATTWTLKELWAKVANECLERTGDEGRDLGSERRGRAAGAARAAPVPMKDAATAAPPAIPAAASSLRRLSSRLKTVSGTVIGANMLHVSRSNLSRLDDSSAKQCQAGRSHGIL